jgi:AraC-like DNA-binding protein
MTDNRTLMIEKMNRIIDYLERNLFCEINLSLISNDFAISSFYLSRWFNRTVGMSLPEYIRKRRLSEAALLLKKTKKTISYISDYTGFNSQKYFSHLFSITYGISPTEYRNRNIFIDLQFKRIINGGMQMKIISIPEFVKVLLQNITNDGELFDHISSIKNCVITEKAGSKVRMVFIFEVDGIQELRSLDINLITGDYTSKLIFSNEVMTDVIMQELEISDERIKLTFIEKNTGEERIAELIERSQRNIYISIYRLADIVSNAESFAIHDTGDFTELDRLYSKIKKANNHMEILNLIPSDGSTVILKSFGFEYVILHITNGKKHFSITSIYFNLQTNQHEQYREFLGYRGDLRPIFRKSLSGAIVEVQGKDYLHCSITSNPEEKQDYFLRFPNGAEGAGKWTKEMIYF